MTGSNEIFIGISFIDVKCIVVDTQIYVEVFFFKIRYLRLTLK